MKIRKGDNVKIISGKDRGKTGKVLKVFPEAGKIVVDKVNLVKRHRKAKSQREQSERVSIPLPIDASNAQVLCPKCSKTTRIGAKQVDGKKVRMCRKCSAEM